MIKLNLKNVKQAIGETGQNLEQILRFLTGKRHSVIFIQMCVPRRSQDKFSTPIALLYFTQE